MAIVFQQPSPVAAAGAVGRAQGLAGAQGQALQAQLAAAQLYSQHAARMASIEQQGAGQVTAANVAGAGMAERAFEAGLDFDSQRLRAQDRQGEIQSQVAGQLMLQNQELTQKENLRLQRLKTAIADVGADVQAGKITPDEGQEIMGQLKYQVSGLEMRKARAVAQSQEMQVQELQRMAGIRSSLSSADGAARSKVWNDFAVYDPQTGEHLGWTHPIKGDFIAKPKPEQPKEAKPAVTPQMAMRLYSDAEKEVSVRHANVTDPAERQRLIDEEYTRRLGKLQAIAGGQQQGMGGAAQTDQPPVNFADQAELNKSEIANNPAIPVEIKVAAQNAIDDARKLLEAVGWDVNKLSKADREKYGRLKNFVNSLPQAPQQQQPQPPQPGPRPVAGPGEAVPGLSTGFGPADFIRRQIGG